MISLDVILLDFVGKNWMSLYLLITIVKGIAMVTPSVIDNQIVTLLGQAFEVIRGKRTVDSLGVASPHQAGGLEPGGVFDPAEKK